MSKTEYNWEELSRRYYAGRTTLAEEEALRAHWRANDPDGAEAQLAAYFSEAATEKVPVDWSKMADRFVESAHNDSPSSAAESLAGGLPRVGKQIVNRESSPANTARNSAGVVRAFSRSRRLWWRVAAAAALVALAFVPWYFQPETSPTAAGFPIRESVDWSQYEIEDPKEARAILSQSLRQVAEPWSKGTRAGQAIQQFQLFNNPLAD